jgi:hypothetical protein
VDPGSLSCPEPAVCVDATTSADTPALGDNDEGREFCRDAKFARLGGASGAETGADLLLAEVQYRGVWEHAASKRHLGG